MTVDDQAAREAFEADLRRRLAVPLNPLAILGNGLAWRSVVYCATSIVIGVVALVAGIVGVILLPWVAEHTARLERVRVGILGLPRLVASGPGDDTIKAFLGRRGSSGSNFAVWGVTVLFGIVDLIPGGPLVIGVVTAVTALVKDIVGNPGQLFSTGTFFELGLLWAMLTVGLYIGWGLAAMQAWAVHALLRPHSDLTRRVAELTSSRSVLVDSFEAERRRIERDLHDGTQQHLVVSTMQLGEAVYWLDQQQPDAARQAVLAAQHSIEDALAQLRDTIRGIHPQVLTDRGLVAALQELAARQPIPVSVDVLGVPRPLPAGLENAAYHIASEAVTNVVKHAGATRAGITLQFSDRFVVLVRDDGRGGARPVPGHGLSGLAERAATAGGTFEVSSPEGGPTLVVASFPVR